MQREPPDNIKPEVLFRLLLKTPRPTLPVDFPLAGADGEAFFVRAVTGYEVFSNYDRSLHEVAKLEDARFIQHLVALSLCTSEGLVFGSHDAVGMLDEDDFARVAAAVLPALWAISPAYGYSDSEAWIRRLTAGAGHHTNMHSAALLGHCMDAGFSLVIARPDRFFGLPTGQLTDGHMLCYYAARRLVESHNPHD